MTEELAIIEGDVVQLGTIRATSPDDVILRAVAIATELGKIIKSRNLFITIKGKEYVRVEGWNTLGAMLGVLPREREVTEIENGYEAYVELVRTNDGVVIGGASSICTRDESLWENRDPYAVRSMAVTRATGKAFRLGFSWVMALAGYEPTPAEEMPHAKAKSETKPAPKSKAVTEKPTGPVGVLLDLGVDNTHHAAQIATLLKFSSKTDRAQIEKLFSEYTACRDAGNEPEKAAEMVLS